MTLAEARDELIKLIDDLDRRHFISDHRYFSVVYHMGCAAEVLKLAEDKEEFQIG